MKKMFGLLGMLLMLAGCSPYALVNSEVYNNADIASYKTFRIITPDDGKMPPGMQMVTYYNIAAAIREQMVDRGFVENPTSPLLINIGVAVHKELQTEPVLPPNYYPYYGPYPGIFTILHVSPSILLAKLLSECTGHNRDIQGRGTDHGYDKYSG